MKTISSPFLWLAIFAFMVNVAYANIFDFSGVGAIITVVLVAISVAAEVRDESNHFNDRSKTDF